jgi:hypothetical protein
MGHLYVLKGYVILVMILRQNEISLPYLPYDCIFTLLHCVNSSLAYHGWPDDGLVRARKGQNMSFTRLRTPLINFVVFDLHHLISFVILMATFNICLTTCHQYLTQLTIWALWYPWRFHLVMPVVTENRNGWSEKTCSTEDVGMCIDLSLFFFQILSAFCELFILIQLKLPK